MCAQTNQKGPKLKFRLGQSCANSKWSNNNSDNLNSQPASQPASQPVSSSLVADESESVAMHQEYLLPEAGFVSEPADDSRRQVFASKLKKVISIRNGNPRASRFLQRTAGGRNRLMENFSEFLATRNVIVNEGMANRYDKLVSHQQQQTSINESLIDLHRGFSNVVVGAGEKANKFSEFKQEKKKRTATREKGRRINGNGSRNGNGNGRGQRTISMLGALFSLKQRNKRFLIANLLRAPTVLAALFSLMLVVTLIVLYSLSFSHPASVATFVPVNSSGQTNLKSSPPTRQSHRINSRHLSQSSRTNPELELQAQAKDDEAEAEAENETAEAAGQELPDSASLGRAAFSVQTECGQLVGSAQDNGLIFEGIPYASPPIGRRRWQRPQPIWLDKRLCLQANGSASAGQTNANRRAIKRHHCAQLSPLTNRLAGHEDCLYLDIYLARLDQAKRLPVMVYIHGGFLAFGSSGANSSSSSSNWMKAKPSVHLAAELDVILVAVNYRLQALGFLTLPELAGGNFGLWDQLTALNWIKRNIESFGGDPNNIVLFGPDSASSLVWALLGNQRRLRQNSPAKVKPPPISALSGDKANLFRAAWLTNPTVFYDLPYELAGQHYQRLFINQAACLEAKRQTNGTGATGNNQHEQQLNGTTRSEASQPATLKDCLLELSGEQVMRHYLGNDDPSYRLDDQNSLPIHGIFADQFVTVDGELVQGSFPFKAASQCKRPASSANKQEINLPKSSAATLVGGLTKNSTGSYAIENSTSEREATTFRKQPEEAAKTSTKINDDSANNNNNGGQEDDASQIEMDGCVYIDSINDRPAQVDLLIGSTAQAVEYWPCPRNLNQWNWDDFKRYVATSLNSFSNDLYKRASSLYNVPKGSQRVGWTTNSNNNKQQQIAGATPAWTYLTMVSDIRQICPINELADNLRLAEGLSVNRYIVESRPAVAGQQQAMSTKEQPYQQQQKLHSSDNAEKQDEPVQRERDDFRPDGRPQFAYHTKDLTAFFGYEFDPTFAANERDLKFQAKIRQMVKQFVHKQPNDKQTDASLGKQIAILADDGSIKYVNKYRHTECSMWRRHLGESYAWLS